MGELRRIVCQKKYLLAVFVLLIANLFLFQYYQMDNLQALRDKETRQDTIDVWQEEHVMRNEAVYGIDRFPPACMGIFHQPKRPIIQKKSER